MDSLDGGSLLHGDRAWCIASGAFWIYEMDSGSAQTENGTTIIAPDTNAGNKRWIRCTRGA